MAAKTPQSTLEDVLRSAEGTHPLATQHAARLQPRLAAGFIPSIRTDAALLRTLSSGTAAVRADKTAATGTQDQAIADGARVISDVRALIKSGAPDDKALWKAFGVGEKANGSVGAVSKGLTTIVTNAPKNAAKLALAGVIQDDLARAQACLTLVLTANESQEGKKGASVQATAAVSATHLRLENNLKHLATVARVALPADVAAQFEALLPPSRKGKGKAKPGPQPGAPG